MPIEAIMQEYEISGQIQNALDNVPSVYELVQYHNRYGIVYSKIEGKTMLEYMIGNIKTLKATVQLPASLHAKMHSSTVSIPCSVKEKLARDIDAGSELSPQEKDCIKNYLQTLPEGTALCHFDYHPGNVLLTATQPFIIDWIAACTGDCHADVARTWLLFQFGEMPHAIFFVRTLLHFTKKYIGVIYLKEYQKITGATYSKTDWQVK